jgi:bifunctional pyridoxal-dependent enzyme with beta-cystathionase and maltose regulon repressor activities
MQGFNVFAFTAYITAYSAGIKNLNRLLPGLTKSYK